MQREDVERLTHRLDRAMLYLPDGDTTAMGEEAAAALRALLDRAERAEAEVGRWRAFQGPADDAMGELFNMALPHAPESFSVTEIAEGQEETAADYAAVAQNVISIVGAAFAALLAERDAAFAAGQEEMRERAEELYASDDEWDYFHAFVYRLRALPLKDSP